VPDEGGTQKSRNGNREENFPESLKKGRKRSEGDRGRDRPQPKDQVSGKREERGRGKKAERAGVDVKGKSSRRKKKVR